MASEGDPSWFATAVGTGIAAFVLAIRQFFVGRKEAARADQHVIVEAGELADMEDFRKLARQFGPALERLARIDHNAAETAVLIRDILDKMEEMERSAQVAKLVRDEVARRLEAERHARRGDREDA